jgi:hypothetical protein
MSWPVDRARIAMLSVERYELLRVWVPPQDVPDLVREKESRPKPARVDNSLSCPASDQSSTGSSA